MDSSFAYTSPFVKSTRLGILAAYSSANLIPELRKQRAGEQNLETVSESIHLYLLLTKHIVYVYVLILYDQPTAYCNVPACMVIIFR